LRDRNSAPGKHVKGEVMAKRDGTASGKRPQSQATSVYATENANENVTALAARGSASPHLSAPPNSADDQTALRILEERYHALVLATGQITWIARGDGDDIAPDVGRDWRLFTGQDMEATQADGWQDAVHPDDRERVAAAWTAAVAARSAYEIEYRVRRYDGEYRWLLVRGVPTLEADGAVREWVGTATDITARKQAESALIASEAQQANELADMRQLQRVSDQLIREGNLNALYEQMVDAAIAVMRSDMGSMQMLVPARNALQLIAWKGFDPASAAFWEWVRADSGSSCGAALAQAERIIVPDVEASDFMAGTEDLEEYRRSGIRAVQSTPLVSRSGRVVGMISTHWRTPQQPPEHNLRLLDVLARQGADLIERKQAEEAAAHLAAIVTSTTDAIASKTLEGIITSWNDSAERMFGYTAQEIIGRSVLLLIPPDLHSQEDTILARIRAGERIEHFETVRVTKDGRLLEVSLTISPIRDNTGAIIGASKIVRDITERKRTEQLLAEQNHLLELIATGRPLDECLTEVTSAVTRLQSRTRAALLLADAARTRFIAMYASSIPPSFGAGLQDAPITEPAIGSCAAAVLSGEPMTCEDIAHDDHWAAEWRDLCLAHGILACHSEPVKGSDGKPLASLMLCFDEPRTPSAWDLRIADFGAYIASIAIERDRTVEALRASERIKDEFIGIASHELRTPLTSITANVQIARRVLAPYAQTAAATGATDTDESQSLPSGSLRRLRRLLESSDRQLSHLARLVSDLLDVSRIQAGKMELRPEPCDLLDIVAEAVEGQRVVWPDRRISLDLAGLTSLALVADADRVGQVVTNYLTNALKYSAPDQPVDVRACVAEGQGRVEVCDHGPGLTPDEQEHVFESFYRAPGVEQLSGSGAGLGLGLHICKTIIERHGGTVGVESKPGAGSAFWFTLPLLGESGMA
jgi:PAS domain S-box-containing protein